MKIKKWALKFFIGYICSLTVIFLSAVYILPGQLSHVLESKMGEALHSKVSIGTLNILWWSPLGLTLKNVKIENPDPKTLVTVDQMTLILKKNNSWFDFKTLNLSIQASIDHPVVTQSRVRDLSDGKLSEPAQPTSVLVLPDLPTLFAPTPLKQLALDVSVTNGELNLLQTKGNSEERLWSVKNLNFHASLPDLSAKLKMNTQMLLESPLLPTPQPLPFSMAALWALRDGVISMEQGELNLIGLQLKLTGQYVMNQGRHFWKAYGSYDDLSKISLVKAPQLPITQWAGQFSTTLVARKTSFTDPWLIDGNTNLKSFLAHLDFNEGGNSLKGPLKINLESQFRYQKKLETSDFRLKADLSALQLKLKNNFMKASGTPFTFVADGFYDENRVTINQILLQLQSMKAILDGNIESTGLAALRFFISPSSLVGTERFFPFLNPTPVSGMLSILGNMRGLLSEPMTWQMSLDQFKLTQFAGSLHWIDPVRKISLEGPLQAHVDLQLSMDHMEIKKSKLTATANLTNLALLIGDWYQKPAEQKWLGNIVFKSDAEVFQLDRAHVNSEPFQLDMKGKYSRLSIPEINGTLNLKNWSLEKTKTQVPYLQGILKNGETDLEAFVKGPISFSEIVKNHLAIEIKSSQFSSPSFSYDGLRSQLNLQNGTLSGKFNFAKVFGGPLTGDEISLNFSEKDPSFIAKMQFQNTDLASTLLYLNSPWKGISMGRAYGQLQVKGKIIKQLSDIQTNEAVGALTLENGQFENLRFVESTLAALNSSTPPASKPSSSDRVSTKFEIKNKNLLLTDVVVVNSQRDELRVQGWSGADARLNLSGIVMLTQKPGQRFPVQIQGTAQRPLMTLIPPVRALASATDGPKATPSPIPKPTP